MPQYRYPIGTPSVGGVDRLLIEKQDDIRRQLDPKFPPKGFPADPWIVPTSLFTKAQTTEIQNYANAAAIRSDAEDARVNFGIQSFREIELGKFQRQGTYRPLKPEERAVIEERRRVQATLDQMRREHPGVVREVEWDDGTQAIFDHFNRQEGEAALEAARANSPYALDAEGTRNPMALDGGGSPFSLDPSGRRNPYALSNPRASEGYSTIKNVAEAMGAAFDGQGFIRELTTWTTAWASDPTLNPEEWAANKKAWEPEFDAMYADLPRPAQVFIDELAPGNIALTIGLGGLSTVLSASGSPIARAISAVTAPVTKNPWTMVAHEAAVSTAARVGYEESDGAPLPIRLAVGAAAAAVTANPRAITAPTGRRIQTAWKGLTEPPVATSPAPSAGTVLGAQIAPRPPEVKTAASGLAPIPDVIDIELPPALRSYRSPVRYPATESAQTALDRAADLQMQRGVRDGQPHGLGVPGNAAHALARAEDALEFAGNNRFINAINRATDDPIIRQSYWAEQAASSEYAARIYPSRVKFLSYLEQTFGSTRNLPDAFEYVGPQSRRLHGIGISGNNGGNQVAAADHPLTGTIYDYLMNRDFYATPQGFDDSSFRNVLRWYNNRNLRANEALRGYGAEIGDFGTTTEDFYFPTINRASQIASIADPDAQARAVSGRLRERQFDSIAQRFMLPLEEQGGVFDPELDFAVAFTAVDNAKAMAAGRNTFRLGLGGSLEPRAGWIEVPALSNQNQTIYLPEEQAKTVARYFDQGDSVKVFNWLNILKNTALNADASPLTIQGSLAWFASPYDTTAQLVGAAARGDTFRAISKAPEYLAESVAADPKGWTDFAFWMGMSPNAGTPQEFRTGLLEAIPGIGSKIGDWNDSAMSVLMQWMKREFHDQAGMLVKEGWSQDQAFAAAADVVRMVVPMTDTRKLGITATGNILQRAAVTSVSFIRQPIQFMDDAMTGYLKLGAKIPDEMLGAIRRGGRRLEEVIPERQSLQVELDTAAQRIDQIDQMLRPGGDLPLPESAPRIIDTLPVPEPLPVGVRAAPENIAKRTWYHGTGTPDLAAENLSPALTNENGLIGQGIYLTDNPHIAGGYAGARRNARGTPTIYQMSVQPQRVLDLNEKAAPELTGVMQAFVDNTIPDEFTEPLVKALANPDATGFDLWRAMRESLGWWSEDARIPSYEFAEIIGDNVTMPLQRLGFDAYTHTGGIQGGAEHQVLVLFDPNSTIDPTGRKVPIKGFSSFAPDAVDTAAAVSMSRETLRAERMNIANSIKAVQGEMDGLLEEESALRLTGRAFAPGTREAWAALTPRERAAAQTFAKMTGGITGLTALSAMLTADSRGLTPQEALERALPGQPDFWKLFIGSEASINIGGPLRSLAQAIMPGENGIPFENFPRYVRSKITPPISAIGELIANEDYYGQEIRSGNFAQQVFDSLAYAVRQIAPVSVVTPFELASQGYSPTQIASQTAGQFLGQNIVPPSHYERLERVRRQSARDLLADPTQWEAQGMTQEQMNAARSARNLTELRAALGTRAANHLVEFGNPEAEDALTAYLGELRRRAEGGDRDAEALLVSFDAQQRLEGLAMTSVDANGVVDKEAYRNARGQVITEMVGRNSAFADVFEGFGTSSNEVDRLSSQWYELFDRASVRVEVDGEEAVVGVDYELFNQLEEQFFAGLGPEKAALVEANVAVAPRGANPLEVELREVRGDLEASGFWDIDDDVWGTVRKGAISTVTQLMEAGQLGERLTTEASKELTAALLTAPTYSDFRQQVTETLTQQIANTGIAPETAVQIAKQKLGGLPDIRAIDDAISEKKVEWAVGNQELAESAIQWGYLSASESNIAASQLDRLQQRAPQPEQGAQPAPTGGGKGINSEAFQPLDDDFKPKRSSSAELSRMATDFTEHGLSYAQLAEKYGLPSRGAAEQRLRRHFGESPAAVRGRLREPQT